MIHSASYPLVVYLTFSSIQRGYNGHMITNESIAIFKKLFLQEYGVELSEAETYERASNLVNLYRVVYLPSKKIKQEEVNEKAV